MRGRPRFFGVVDLGLGPGFCFFLAGTAGVVEGTDTPKTVGCDICFLLLLVGWGLGSFAGLRDVISLRAAAARRFSSAIRLSLVRRLYTLRPERVVVGILIVIPDEAAAISTEVPTDRERNCT